MRLDKMLLAEILARGYPAQDRIDIDAIKSLALTKGLYTGDIPATGDPLSTDPRIELVRSLSMARGGPDAGQPIDALRHPVARAAYLKCRADKADPAGRPDLGDLILAEVDSSRGRIIWESRIMLSEAMLDFLPTPDAFRRMGNYAVSDLSVRNNSPEWLAIYARAGLSEASQLSLVSQLIYNLSQHYPQAIGLYEIVQSYNHLCKYY